MKYIGIDPGKTGGIAVMDHTGLDAWATKIPDTERDILELFEDISGISKARLEFVRSSPQMGVKSAFTFGWGYGGLRMALAAMGISYSEVTPGRWQKDMRCRTGGDKNITKKRAQQLFPKLKITHATADALLICEWGRRTELGLSF